MFEEGKLKSPTRIVDLVYFSEFIQFFYMFLKLYY